MTLLDQLDAPEVAPPPVAPPPVSVTPAQIDLPVGSIMDRAVCLAIDRGKFNNSRKIKIDDVMNLAVAESGGEADVDPHSSRRLVDRSLLSASKRLLAVCEELKAINRVDSDITRYLKEKALPNAMFRSGFRLIAIPEVIDVDTTLRALKLRREEAVRTFVAAYGRLINDARESLGDLFSERDYPTASDVEGLFTFEWQFVEFSTPGTLKQIKATLFQDEAEKAQVKLTEATETCRAALRASFAGFVDKLRERLTPEVDETTGTAKKKKFKAATVEHLNTFMSSFDVRNITDDRELGALVARARSAMQGLDPEALRSDDLLRERVRQTFDQVAGSLETMTVDRGSRRINLE